MRLAFGSLLPIFVLAGRKRKLAPDSTPIVPLSDTEAREIYTSSSWSDMDEREKRRFRPSKLHWTDPEERVPVYLFSSSNITFGPVIARTSQAAVYRIDSHPDWVIKYHSYCKFLEENVETTLRETYFMNLVYAHFPTVTTKLLYFSNSIVPSTVTSLKRGSSCMVCPTGHPPVVRYMISERVGESIDTLVAREGAIDFLAAIRIGIELFDLLEKIHSIRVIHGDIHGSNIAFRNDKPVLIDFGRGTIGPDDMDIVIHEEVPPTTTDLKCHPTISLWETVRNEPALSYRDDAFRAALVLGLMIHGPQHRLARKDVCGDSIRVYHEYLRSLNFFDGSVCVRSKRYDLTLPKVLPTLHRTEHIAISDHFADMLRYIRGLAYGEVPDYNRVKAELIAVQQILISRD